MSEHAEWAVRLDDGAVLLRCTCGWQEHVPSTGHVAAAVRDHKPLVPQQPGEVPHTDPVGRPPVLG